MSETISRTIYVDTVNGTKCFGDWALVNTTLGQMVEPFVFNRFFNDGTAFDPSESFMRIDEIQEVDFDQLAGMFPFSDIDGTRLHGGIRQPRIRF